MAKRVLIKTVLVGGAMLLGCSALASDIYRFVDRDGNVHYGDRPSGNPTEQRLAIVSRSTNPAAVRSSIEARLERDALREEARQARASDNAMAAEARQDAAQQTALCEENRTRLETYNESRRLYREDENGERVYLDDAQRAEAEQKVRDLIKEHCG